ncbi:MAG TPA: SIMPL domain-containing protein [Acidimicrobiia bacterium]|nr:SIMPL domain-containing protein [Acidimicrobiia bacterium]
MLRARPALTLAAGAAAAALLLAGCGQDRGSVAEAATASGFTADDDRTPRIAARGVGQVKGTPDTLRVTLGVETRSASAQEALAANNDKANALVNTLKEKGVDAKDIQTSQLSIHPNYDDKGQRIVGYQVNNIVTATLHDIGAAGGLIDAAAGAVGDAVRVQSVAFAIDDDSALKAEARTQAVRLAQLQAEQMAKAAGVKLGRIRSISEVPGSNPMPYSNHYAGDAAKAAAGSVPAPVLPGQQELSLTVDVVWDITQ